MDGMHPGPQVRSSAAPSRRRAEWREVDVGVEPPIRLAGRSSHHLGSRSVSLRWLAAVVLTGIAGAGLIGATVLVAMDGRTEVAQAPELAGTARSSRTDQAGPVRGDRLVRSADVVAERQTFRAPVSVRVGDKQVIRTRGFTRVATTLALAPAANGDEVPDFDPIRLMAQDENPAEAPPIDPGPALSDADVSFTTRDLGTMDPNRTGGGGFLSTDEIQAQVAALASMAAEPNRTPPSGQALLARTSLAGPEPTERLDRATATPRSSTFASIEVHMVAENVTVVPRSDAGREREPVERLVVFRRGDDLEGVLRANGATRDQARAILGAFAPRRGEPPVAEGRRLRLSFARLDDGRPRQIARVSVYADETLETTIALTDAGGYAKVAGAEASRRPAAAAPSQEEGGLRLYDSFYETALRQSVPKPLIGALMRIFGNDVDFQRSVAGGDGFDAFYADEDASGRGPELLYASITVRNETFRYYRFVTPDDNTVDYYDENGRSVRKFLIRNPVPNGLFTSAFGMRFHPVLGYSRPHTGVDWTAPIGTPILASGSGSVLKAERSSSYGNHVEIQHANGYLTTYSHMTGFARGIVAGARVRQGQVVGYLGQTGLATGPHLHYEVIVNGHFVDPMKVKLARTREMDGRVLADFKRERDRIDALMASTPDALASAGGRHAAN
jgi:murein DD-endopeptidase MepM/ murein hydrolase activator NlpD